MAYQCPDQDCVYEHESLNSLRIHCQKRHKLPSADMVVAVLHGGVWPTCECGCGERLKYKNLASGFGRLRRGHVNRIPGRNNFHQPGTGAKISSTRKRLFAEGKLQHWAKGLTKETDLRVAKLAKTTSETIMANVELRKARSEMMRENRLNGTIPTLRGPSHSQWKGGTSAISARLGSQLYHPWIFPKLRTAGFKCVRCEATGKLEVHHDGERKADIIRHCREILFPDLSRRLGWDEETQVVGAAVAYHVEHDVSGLVLCKGCHIAEHERLGEVYNL